MMINKFQFSNIYYGYEQYLEEKGNLENQVSEMIKDSEVIPIK